MQAYTQTEVNALYESDLSSSLVLSRTVFTLRANQTINERFEAMQPYLKYGSERVCMLYRGNLIVNAFNTDWTLEYGNASNGYLLRGVPRVFSNSSCNCILSSDCQQPLRIGPPDLVLPGLVVGCSPLYGLRLSTLECLYSSDCIDKILNHLNYYRQADGSEPSNFTAPIGRPLMITPLLLSKSVHFLPTTRIESIVDEAFIDTINRTISYEKYFRACGAKSCHYELVKNSDIAYALTSLLGLYGGLTLSLRFIIWNLARIHQMIKRRLGTRTTSIEPFSTESVTPSHTDK